MRLGRSHRLVFVVGFNIVSGLLATFDEYKFCGDKEGGKTNVFIKEWSLMAGSSLWFI